MATGGSLSYDGVELALVVDPTCLYKNHRESTQYTNGDISIRIPGLYPRWIDFERGGWPQAPNVGSCLTFDNGNSENLLASDGLSIPISNA